jgi:hypothetical protein
MEYHKSIICTQSAYFEKAFQGSFIEGNSSVLTFSDGSGAAYWRIFEYLYTGDYSDDLKLQRKLQDLWTCDSHQECIREIYTSTPHSDLAMRYAVVEVAKVHTIELGEKAVFKDLIREGGDSAVQYFESVIFSASVMTSKTYSTGFFDTSIR